jgi:AraC-like DNA-binding protein
MLTLFFLVSKRGYPLENKLMAMFLLIFNLQVFYSFATSFYAWPVFMEWHKPLFILRQMSLLLGPLLYFYVRAFYKKKNMLTNTSLLHFLPFAGMVIFLLFYYLKADRFVIWLSVIDLYTTILILAHTLLYIILSVVEVRTDSPGLKYLYRSLISNRWLQILLLGFMMIWVVNLNSFALYMIVQRPGWCAYTDSIYGLTVFLFINAVMFVMLYKPDAHFFVPKYRNSRLAEPDKLDYLQKLKSYMEAEKPFLNPDITLEVLANELNINPRLLSQIINDSFKKNFKSFILEYRIQESMRILADQKHSRLTILEILYQVGFNSKSAFNNQFKLYTNLTPLEYRAQAIG